MRLWLPSACLLFGVLIAGPARSQGDPAPGVVVERVRATARAVHGGDGILTLVRVDLRRYRLRILTEERHGARRPADRWVRDHHLSGAINAGMFLPNGRSVGFMKQDGAVVSDRHVSRYHSAVGFGAASGSPFVVGGRGCRGNTLAQLRRRFDNVLQAYGMVDCHGEAVLWPHRRRFSAAGFGVDRQGRAVFVHTRTPYRMATLNRMLAAPELGLAGLIYMEGGPEASLFVDAEGQRVREIGSWEDGFNPNDDNHVFWDLPNIIAFEPRPTASR